MLKHLRIRNFAIIDEVAIDFGSGLNIISGETGAGKSILMDALALILGGRASSDLIRSGAEEAEVEALFDLGEDADLIAGLDAQGIRMEDGDLIVRRIVQRSGKNRIFVNGTMVNMATLQAVTASLVDLCSQHDQQLLARPEEQLLWVDSFGELLPDRQEIRSLYREWRERSHTLESLSTDSAQRAQKIDFLRFQISELEDAQLGSPSEDQEIEQELKVLGNAETLFSFASEAEGALFGLESADGPSMLDKIGALVSRTRPLTLADPKLNEALDHLVALKLHADELGFFLRSYAQSLSRDESRLEDLNARLALLTKLKRKYGPQLSDVIQNLDAFRKDLSLLENHDTSLSDAIAAEEEAKNRLFAASEKLSQRRARAAKAFSQEVVGELADLHMTRARFQVSLQRQPEAGPSGIDLARFEIAANPGEPPGPMNKVASGGELSRIMLAMHNVVSSLSNVSVYLFDEVDTGIGGATAATVGAKLSKVAHKNQVICITHLPQVAAFASVHLHVEKIVQRKGREERTIVSVRRLGEAERELEIARMLGGLGNSKAALANARSMIQLAAGKGRGSAAKEKAPRREQATKGSKSAKSW
jgi:DNA repair protein RecN (Recombination protein N)